MTKLLEKALEKISSLPQEDQDAIASQILAELEDEAAWAKRSRSIAKERLARWMISFDRIPQHAAVP